MKEKLRKTEKSGYRGNEIPTGEEIKNIVEFYYKMTGEQYKDIRARIISQEKRYKKAVAVLTALNIAIAVILIRI